MARSSKCKACSARTIASAGFCQWCKSKRHHGYKRIKGEGLTLDEAGGAWWIWNPRGDVLVAGKPTREAAVIALGAGDVDDVEENEANHSTIKRPTRKKTAAQLEREIAASLAPGKAAGIVIVDNTTGVASQFHDAIVKAILRGGQLPEALEDIITLTPVTADGKTRWIVNWA